MVQFFSMVPPEEVSSTGGGCSRRIETPKFGSSDFNSVEEDLDDRKCDVTCIPSAHLFRKPVSIEVTHLRNQPPLCSPETQATELPTSSPQRSQSPKEEIEFIRRNQIASSDSVADTATPPRNDSDQFSETDEDDLVTDIEPDETNKADDINNVESNSNNSCRSFIDNLFRSRKRIRSLRVFKARLIQLNLNSYDSNYSPFWTGSNVENYSPLSMTNTDINYLCASEKEEELVLPVPTREIFDRCEMNQFEESMVKAYEDYVRENESLRTLLRKTAFFSDGRKNITGKRRRKRTNSKEAQVKRYILRFLQANQFSIEDTVEHIECVCEWMALQGYQALLTKCMFSLLSTGGARIIGYDKQFRPLLVCHMNRLTTLSKNNILLVLAYHLLFFRSSLSIRGKVEQIRCVVDCAYRTDLIEQGWKILQIQAIFPFFIQQFHFINVPPGDHFTSLQNNLIEKSPTQTSTCLLELFRLNRISVHRSVEELLEVVAETQLTEEFGGIRCNITESEWLNSHIPISFNCTCESDAITRTPAEPPRHYLGDILYVGRLNYRCGSGLLAPSQCVHTRTDREQSPLRDLQSLEQWTLGEFGELVESKLLDLEELSRHCGVSTHSLQAEESIKHYARNYVNISLKIWSLSALASDVLARSGSVCWHGRDANNRPILVANVRSLAEKASQTTNSQLVEYLVYWINFGLTYLVVRCCERNSAVFSVVADFKDITIETPPALCKALSVCHSFFPNMMYRCFILNCDSFQVQIAIDTFFSAFRSRLTYITTRGQDCDVWAFCNSHPAATDIDSSNPPVVQYNPH